MGEDAFNRRVQIFHGVFNGYDVAGGVFVAPVEHCCHGGGFTRTGCTGKNNQTARLHGEFFQSLRKLQFVHGQDFGGDAPPHHAGVSLFVVGIDTVAHTCGGRYGIVDFQLFFKAGALFGGHGGIHQNLRILRGERFERNGDKFAVDFE